MTAGGRSQPGAPKPLKIVVTGPFAAGKTTLIETISEVATVGTERGVSDDTASIKESTTVAMDFGRLTFDRDCSLYLFGTPGQRRFEIMWEVLAQGMIGFIVLVNAADVRSAPEASHILRTFQSYADVPYVVGVTHLDLVGGPRESILAHVRRTLSLPSGIQVVACDPRSKEDIKGLMLTILYEVLQRLDGTQARVISP